MDNILQHIAFALENRDENWSNNCRGHCVTDSITRKMINEKLFQAKFRRTNRIIKCTHKYMHKIVKKHVIFRFSLNVYFKLNMAKYLVTIEAMSLIRKQVA